MQFINGQRKMLMNLEVAESHDFSFKHIHKGAIIFVMAGFQFFLVAPPLKEHPSHINNGGVSN